MTRILIVDDHPVIRSGLMGLLETEDGFEVAGTAASGEEAIELLRGIAIDVVLMDLRMPGMGGVEATRRIVQGESRPANRGVAGTAGSGPTLPAVLVFTTYEDDDQILAAIEAGASGYLLKAAPAEELIAGIRAAGAGQTVLAPSIAAQLARAVGSRAPGREAVPGLTARELEILNLVGEGLSNPKIAARLHIGESTVKTHLLHAFEKLGVNDRTRAVTRAMELGVL